MTIAPKELAAGIALFGGALITLGTIGYAIYRAAAAAFSTAVNQHVAPLFNELRLSISQLTATMSVVKNDHDSRAERVDERLDGHDAEIGHLAERAARIEGKLS